MIHNIVFDMGNVLIRFEPESILARLGASPEDVRLVRKAVFDGVEWIQGDRGTISEEALSDAVCGRLPARLHPIAREFVCGWWRHPFTFMPGMSELITELKAVGYGIYLLSNASTRLHDYFPRLPASACFDGIIVSADHHFLKPQTEIYRVLFDTYHLDPASCLFIDDLAINVEGSIHAGMDAIVFHGDAAALRRELQKRGVKVSSAA